MSIILKAENISKQYRLGMVGTGTISHDLNRWWAGLRGKEDPYLKVGAVNDRSVITTEDYVWALRDINFEVKQGEILGIIGKNGAGKSTLLKILSRVTAPTTGSIKTAGRIASLLEVGTGFNGELTGRENLFMNGAILGMTKKEIKGKLDEIIDFSGCEMYIDTPVKRYSSGMTVRLGFAVAAHLEPEILVVDEVLAVGDAEFQQKALGKMNSLSKGEGRTVLFVSHNMASVKSLCSNVILLDNGMKKFEGEVGEGINIYLNSGDSGFDNTQIDNKIKYQDDEIFLLKMLKIWQNGSSGENFYSNKEIIISLEYHILKDVLGLRIGFDFIDLASGSIIFRSYHDDSEKTKQISVKGNFVLQTAIPSDFLKKGAYGIKLAIGIHNIRWIIFEENIMFKFRVFDVDGLNSAFSDYRPGYLLPKLGWQYISKI